MTTNTSGACPQCGYKGKKPAQTELHIKYYHAPTNLSTDELRRQLSRITWLEPMYIDELMRLFSTYQQRELAHDKPDVRPVVQWDYNRLLRLEQQGLDDMATMRAAPKLTPENVCWFINQLSPWNLKTTGLAVLEAYVVQATDPASEEMSKPELVEALKEVEKLYDQATDLTYEIQTPARASSKKGKHHE